jgi:hypothetical protein
VTVEDDVANFRVVVAGRAGLRLVDGMLVPEGAARRSEGAVMPQKKPKKTQAPPATQAEEEKEAQASRGSRQAESRQGTPQAREETAKALPLKRRPRRSGSIPRACRRLIGEAKLLDCWLNQNPDVANAIVWQPAPGAFDTSTVAWPAWTAAMKGELRQAWMDARAWHENGMSHFGGPALPDPLPNLDPLRKGHRSAR